MNEMTRVNPLIPKPLFTHRHRCELCKDSGAVLAVSRELGGGPYAFRCYCERGMSRRLAYPFWQPIKLAEYELVK